MLLKNNCVILPSFKIRNLYEVKELFEFNKVNLGVEYDFNFLINNTQLFALYKDGILMGCIYYFQDNILEKFVYENYKIKKKGGGGSLLFMNGFSKRKMMKENIATIHLTAKYYLQDIYSLTDKKPAVRCLLTAGFRNIKANSSLLNTNIRLFKLKNKSKKGKNYGIWK